MEDRKTEVSGRTSEFGFAILDLLSSILDPVFTLGGHSEVMNVRFNTMGK